MVNFRSKSSSPCRFSAARSGSPIRKALNEFALLDQFNAAVKNDFDEQLL